jgi:hypothetical protein
MKLSAFMRSTVAEKLAPGAPVKGYLDSRESPYSNQKSD